MIGRTPLRPAISASDPWHLMIRKNNRSSPLLASQSKYLTSREKYLTPHFGSWKWPESCAPRHNDFPLQFGAPRRTHIVDHTCLAGGWSNTSNFPFRPAVLLVAPTKRYMPRERIREFDRVAISPSIQFDHGVSPSQQKCNRNG